jgi:hypothetical protein
VGKVALKYSAVLIGTYLLVYYATGAGKVIQQGGSASVGLVKAFQGR